MAVSNACAGNHKIHEHPSSWGSGQKARDKAVGKSGSLPLACKENSMDVVRKSKLVERHKAWVTCHARSDGIHMGSSRLDKSW